MEHQEHLPLTPRALKQRLKSMLAVPLTAREVDVVAGLIGKRDSKNVGRLLRIAHHTVRNHVGHIFSKLDCHAQHELIDHLEAQGVHEFFRQHYLHLQFEPWFQQLLQGLRDAHTSPPQLLSVHGATTSDHQSWIESTEHDLAQAGFQVIDTTPEDWLLELNQNTVTHLLYWDTDQSHTHTMDQGLWHRSVDDTELTWIHLSHGTAPHLAAAADTTMALQHHANYHAFMLQLCQAISPQYDVSPVQAHHQRILGHAAFQSIHSKEHSEPRVNLDTEAPITWDLPLLMPYYTERSELTQHIWQQLQRDLGQSRLSLVSLRGMGGVGKTTLALEAIHHPKQPYHFRGWFKAETSTSLQEAYLDLASTMHITTQEMSEQQKIQAVKSWLAQQPSALLVYDNAPDMATIRDYLPHQGHCLITSRNDHMPYPINIEGMQGSEAIALLAQLISMSPAPTQSALSTLADTLGYLPLALSQAGAYITAHQLSVQDYLERYQVLQTQLLSQQLLPPGDPHQPAYVTWDLNIQALQTHDEGQQAQKLLAFMAYLAPEDMPKSLLAQYLVGEIDEIALFELESVINQLRVYSLVKVTPKGVSMHRLVQAFLRSQFDTHQLKTTTDQILQTISDIHSIHCWDYQLAQSLLPHGEALKHHISQFHPSITSMAIEHHLAWMYLASGHYHTAQSLLESLMAEVSQQHQTDHNKLAAIHNDLGYVLRELGQPIAAKQHYQQALTLYQAHDQHHIGQAHTYAGLGWVCQELGEFTAAQHYYKNSLSRYHHHGYNHHVWVAHVENGLGALYRRFGQLKRSKTKYDRALLIYQQQLGPQHVWTAHVYRSLGSYYRESGQLTQAEICYQQALTVFTAHYGPNHSWCARIQNRLGWIYHQSGRLNEAQIELEQVLTVYQNHFGLQSKRVAHVYHGLSMVHLALNQLDIAQSYSDRARQIYRDYGGENSIWMGYTCHGLGLIQLARGHWQGAKPWLEQALVIHQNHYGNDCIWTAEVHLALGRCELGLQQMDQARVWLVEKALPLFEQHHGTRHCLNRTLYESLAQLHTALGDSDASQRFAEQAKLAVQIDVTPPSERQQHHTC